MIQIATLFTLGLRDAMESPQYPLRVAAFMVAVAALLAPILYAHPIVAKKCGVYAAGVRVGLMSFVAAVNIYNVMTNIWLLVIYGPYGFVCIARMVSATERAVPPPHGSLSLKQLSTLQCLSLAIALVHGALCYRAYVGGSASPSFKANDLDDTLKMPALKDLDESQQKCHLKIAIVGNIPKRYK